MQRTANFLTLKLNEVDLSLFGGGGAAGEVLRVYGVCDRPVAGARARRSRGEKRWVKPAQEVSKARQVNSNFRLVGLVVFVALARCTAAVIFIDGGGDGALFSCASQRYARIQRILSVLRIALLLLRTAPVCPVGCTRANKAFCRLSRLPREVLCWTLVVVRCWVYLILAHSGRYRRYFSCPDEHGLFVRPANVTLVSAAPPSPVVAVDGSSEAGSVVEKEKEETAENGGSAGRFSKAV